LSGGKCTKRGIIWFVALYIHLCRQARISDASQLAPHPRLQGIKWKRNIDVCNVALQDKDMVSALLEMKVQLDTVLTQAFQKNEQFSNALKEAFEKFINQRQNK